MTTGIYKITSPSNRIYIGQSIDIDKRFYSYSLKQYYKMKQKIFNLFPTWLHNLGETYPFGGYNKK